MITIKGKEIKAETISMWFNIIGFIASIIFYVSVEHNIASPVQVIQNPMQDSLVSIGAKLQTQITRLQVVEKSLEATLQAHKEQAAGQQKEVNKVRAQIQLTVHSGWDNLSQTDKDSYTNQLIQKFKKPKR